MLPSPTAYLPSQFWCLHKQRHLLAGYKKDREICRGWIASSVGLTPQWPNRPCQQETCTMQMMHLRARRGHSDTSEAVKQCEDALRKAGRISLAPQALDRHILKSWCS